MRRSPRVPLMLPHKTPGIASIADTDSVALATSDQTLTSCWLVSGIGLLMVVAAVIVRTAKRLLRLSEE